MMPDFCFGGAIEKEEGRDALQIIIYGDIPDLPLVITPHSEATGEIVVQGVIPNNVT